VLIHNVVFIPKFETAHLRSSNFLQHPRNHSFLPFSLLDKTTNRPYYVFCNKRKPDHRRSANSSRLDGHLRPHWRSLRCHQTSTCDKGRARSKKARKTGYSCRRDIFHFIPARFGDNDKTRDLRLVRFTRRSEKQALVLGGICFILFLLIWGIMIRHESNFWSD
jgi:hypothetical protein